MINEDCTKKKSFYITMCKFPEVCMYITVFYSLTFKMSEILWTQADSIPISPFSPGELLSQSQFKHM